jgi:aerobic-type carbon monoxide dehydrogenase small subunit (CoxS/CutS family)
MKALSSFPVSLTVNGNPWSGDVPVEETLMEFLRLRLRLTGTKALLRIGGLWRLHGVGG